MKPRLFGYRRPVLGRHPAVDSLSSRRAFLTPRRRAAFIAVSAAAIAGLAAGPPGTVVFAAAAGRPSSASNPIRVLVDPRTELMSIVFRLAECPEYSQGAAAAYNEAVDAWFGRFKGHAVVRRVRRLRETRGISYNAPMSLAVHLTPGPVRLPADVQAAAGPDELPAAPSDPSPPAIELAERVPLDPLPAEVDERWTPAEARAFLADLRSFVRKAKYAEFLAARSPFYEAATAGLEKVVRETRVVEWLDGFFGAGGAGGVVGGPGGAAAAKGRPPADRPRTDFIVSIGLLNGGGSYGASVNLPDGRREVYSILGAWNIDASGAPRFPPWVASTIVHEFCHSYVNPLVDANERVLAGAGRRIYRLVETEMRKQAYGSWRTMMCESIVRACSVLYTHDVFGAEAADRELAMNRDRGFLWVGRLAGLLGTYRKSREAYPTLGDFFPRIAAFFEDCARADAAAAGLRHVMHLQRLLSVRPRIMLE